MIRGMFRERSPTGVQTDLNEDVVVGFNHVHDI
jgi:hypothetical protein